VPSFGRPHEGGVTYQRFTQSATQDVTAILRGDLSYLVPTGERLLLGCRRIEGEGRGGQNTAVFAIRDHDSGDLVAVVSRYRSAEVASTTR
jgi:hypothetical protein